jgi:hypothetical protein
MADQTIPSAAHSALRHTFEGLLAPDPISGILPAHEVNSPSTVHALYAPQGNRRERLSLGLARRRATARELPAVPSSD